MKKNNSQKTILILTGVILVGLIIIGVWSLLGTKNSGNSVNTGTGATEKPLKITIIDDKRCSACVTKQIGDQIKQLPFLTQATFEEKDFSDTGVSEYLKKNNISFLPAFIFSTNALKDDGGMKDFLVPLGNGEFNLSIGSTFDPFAKRSQKGFLLLEKSLIETVKKESYIDGDKNAKVSWIEYSDIECPFCAKLHNSGVIESIKAKYNNNVNRIFQHFPIIQSHKNALPAAQLFECAGEIGGTEKFYELSKNIYAKEKSDKKFILEEATKIGLDTAKMEVCFDEERYKNKVLEQQKVGSEVFKVSSTPTNILIHNETGEYEIISGALPKEAFEKVVDRLLE